MPFQTTYEFGEPPQQVSIIQTLGRRRLRDAELDVSCDAAWCSWCQQIVPAEYIPTVEDLIERVSNLKRQLRNRRRELAEAKRLLDSTLMLDARVLRGANLDVERTQRQVSDAKAELAWRQSRRSPPRCLRCGSITIQKLDSLGSTRHPAGLGMIRCVGRSHVSTIQFIDGDFDESEPVRDGFDFMYDSEGLPLDRNREAPFFP